MNSVKNAIVTMTLLAVGYGAYVVLSNPVPEDLGDLAEGTVWETPDVAPPTIELGAEADVVDRPPPLDALADSDEATANEVPPANILPMQGPEDSEPHGSRNAAGRSPLGPPHPSANGPSLSAASGSNTPRGEETATDTSLQDSSSANFYVSRSSGPTADTEQYPTTGAPEMPLSSAEAATVNGTAMGADESITAQGSPASAFDGVWQSVQADLRNRRLAPALAALSAWYEEPSLTPQQQDRLMPLLDQLAGTVIFSRDSFLEPAHVVQPNETLSDIAQLVQAPVEFLARINGIEAPYEVFPGESLKVVRGPFRAEVSRSRGQITLFLGRYYAGRFQARIGAELPPEENTYEVVAVEPGLEYFDSRTGRRVGRQDPQNPYGSLWISLRGNQITAAHNVGVHVDTGDPERCCIGVNPNDAADLAAILGLGSSIHIHN